MLKNIKDSLEISYKQGLESDDIIYIKGQIKDWEEMLSNIKHEQELKDNALKMYDEGQQEIERLNNDIKYWEEKYSHTKFDENRYKDKCEKLLEKLNFYENTEWGIRSCEILKIFKNILKGEDKE